VKGDRLFIYADHRLLRALRRLVHLQDVFHLGDILTAQVGHHSQKQVAISPSGVVDSRGIGGRIPYCKSEGTTQTASRSTAGLFRRPRSFMIKVVRFIRNNSAAAVLFPRALANACSIKVIWN